MSGFRKIRARFIDEFVLVAPLKIQFSKKWNRDYCVILWSPLVDKVSRVFVSLSFKN